VNDDDEFAELRREASRISCLATAAVFIALLILAFAVWGPR